MYLSYFDESGDDGYPGSSDLFVLSSVYMLYSDWKENYLELLDYRKHLKGAFNLPVKQEFHTKEFVTDKSPYHGLYTPSQRMNILIGFCNKISQLKIQVISVVIDKAKIKQQPYDILKNSLTYNIQRIENTLKDSKYIIITDDGRVSKMRKTTRAIQQINFIPSSLYPGTSIRKDIQNLIEDPLPKSSNQSYFIQVADTISFVVSLYAKQNLCSPSIGWGKRINAVLSYGEEILLMETLKPILNLKASRADKFGIVCYPK